ncbi:MAG: serine/threonine-protein kinase, partial [Pirellulaceae bacterium]
MNATRRPDPVDVGDLRRFDALCDQFEQAWKRGARPVVADYLADVEATKRAVLVRQLLDVEFQERIARGEMPRADEYAGEDAELSAWIRARLAEVLETLPPTPRTPDETVSPSDESRSPEPTAATTPETTFGKFEVVERLGAGGMGAVYRARHTLVHYERAIKVLHPRLAQHASAVQRFLVEAQACIELSHPHIVTTYHVDQKPDGTIYLVMELLRGEDLSKLVGRTGPLPVDRAVTIVEQVASGLAYAHGRGTVHRDIKPHNILWTEGNVAKILDLGLARILEEPSADITGVDPEEEGAEFDLLLTRFQSRLTQQDAMLGTLPYMAPEQAASARDADGASDIYSLGCTLYFLLTGRHAFVGESAEAILRKHLAGDYIPIRRLRPDVPRELVAIVDRMMARSRSERFATADTVVTALRAWRGGAPAKFSDPIGLDDLPRLRDDLVRLKIITPQAWEAAETQARRQLPANPVSTSASVLTFQAATLESSHVLRELQSLHHPDSSDGLSEFQVQYLLNGDGDLLRPPHHILV